MEIRPPIESERKKGKNERTACGMEMRIDHDDLLDAALFGSGRCGFVRTSQLLPESLMESFLPPPPPFSDQLIEDGE